MNRDSKEIRTHFKIKVFFKIKLVSCGCCCNLDFFDWFFSSSYDIIRAVFICWVQFVYKSSLDVSILVANDLKTTTRVFGGDFFYI